MMKNLLTAAVLVASFTAANAQSITAKNTQSLKARALPTIKVSPQEMTSMWKNSVNHTAPSNTAARTNSIAVQLDTLHYFFNKNSFIDPQPGLVQRFIMTVPDTAQIDLVEFGSSFLNGASGTGAAVTVSGAYIWAKALKPAPTTNATIPVMVYIYGASATGAPLAKLDSGITNVDTTSAFWYASFTTPRTVTGSFYISYKNNGLTTDTLLGMLGEALTPTVGTLNPNIPNDDKYGEGLSYCKIRQLAGATPIYTTMSMTNIFFEGNGTDFEAIVMPTVSFSLNANYTVSAPGSTATPGAYCATTAITFTNTSTSPVLNNRQFNFNTFINYWGPTAGFSNTPLPNAADPINNWVASSAPATTITTTNATVTPTVAGNLTVSLTIEYRPSPWDPNSQKPSIPDMKTSTYSIVACTTATTGTNTGVGIAVVSGFDYLSIFPNPSVNGKTNITGLNGTNSVLVFDMLGQQVMNQTSDKETVSIDLSNKANGTYIVKIINSNNDAKVVRIINQN